MYSRGMEPPLDRIDKFKPGAGLLRLEGDPNIAVLAATAGLADEAALLFNCFANGLLYRRPEACRRLAPTLNSRSKRSTMISR